MDNNQINKSNVQQKHYIKIGFINQFVVHQKKDKIHHNKIINKDEV
jgi:hypothetical protein